MKSSFSTLASLFTVPYLHTLKTLGIAQESPHIPRLAERRKQNSSLNLRRRRVRRQCITSNSNLQGALFAVHFTA
ncbi:hypothetical protein CEXT_17921 [Caerostris extrusa]|uniref:Secreted protein n=1 Tax=Caerostris extrusa TaxID=172846 RepID=A0AAV4UK75_CAEEX|nr:hypothetical protein CEXT_17921 [Caerostris extrusa]